MPTKNPPQLSNNPFAIIDPSNTPWTGVIGKWENGFLKFNTVANGLRAGFLNLKNGYFNSKADGVNNLAGIFTTYLGAKSYDAVNATGDSPKLYAESIQKRYGIHPYTWFNFADREMMIKLAKGIIHQEEGNLWVPEAQIAAAYDAIAKTGGVIPKKTPKSPGTFFDDNGNVFLVSGVLVVAGITLYVIAAKGA